ncbi:hypothetical protein [Roseicyclus mahoneyensis]|uniref:Uncharacterized protein n=1 Tax=Roseicyclus mahoneyensis TaxID=164332 RepID=A0A316GH74_9RHOB|nr:hypothetical protein [Roseicyclus mahoneyensis]PWK60406.1 hypothetical protein C7455_10442 [Roseicyclus mahoneyensis]
MTRDSDQDSDSRTRLTTGAMISTLCFAGAGLALADAAAQAEGLRAAGLWLTAVASGAGALRFQIARVVGWFRKSA